jgi:hypothetical protein
MEESVRLGRIAVQASVGGLWFAFLGWFLLSAARAEEMNARLREGLADIRVRDVMTHDPVVGPAWLTVEAFLHDYVLRHRCSTFPVRGFDGALRPPEPGSGRASSTRRPAADSAGGSTEGIRRCHGPMSPR